MAEDGGGRRRRLSQMLDRFYLIVDSADWLRRLLPTGLRLAQLRVKSSDEAHLRAEIVVARDLCRAANAQLVVNDHWRLAIETGCDFIHLGQEDLDTADVSAIRRAGMKLGISTHDGAELERALSVDPDYIALGPVFPTTLKQTSVAPQGIEPVRRWRKALGARPLVAIGGITLERADDILAAGADSVALSTDVLGAPDPVARARQWVASTR
jgi:thiamine-phosphate pyrophosphorylase